MTVSIQSDHPVTGHSTFFAGIAGILAAGLWQALGQPITIRPLQIYPGMLAYLYLSLAGLPRSRGLTTYARPLWFFAAAMLVTNLPAMTIRGNLPQTTTWNWTFVSGSLALLFILFELWSQRATSDHENLTRREILSVSLIAFAMFVFFQVSNRVLRLSGVANEDRSLMISGVEVHHLTWGPFLVLASGTWWRFLAHYRLPRLMAVLGLSLGFGMIWDQWFYYMLQDLTDDAYFGVSTVLTALLAIVGFPVIWLWNQNAASKRKGMSNE